MYLLSNEEQTKQIILYRYGMRDQQRQRQHQHVYTSHELIAEGKKERKENDWLQIPAVGSFFSLTIFYPYLGY